LFFTLVPHGAEVYEGGLAHSFEDSEEGSEDDEVGEAGGDGVQGEHGTPLQITYSAYCSTNIRRRKQGSLIHTTIIEIPKYFPMGSLWMSQLVGYSTIKIAI
tara:strand:+ start:387 stop:692 length:306 start_codon:yes stop_codon:yes gene_type:complete